MYKKVIGIYLAAGRSTRFKRNKIKALVHGRSLGSIALTEALQTTLNHIVVVINQTDDLSWLPSSYRQHYAQKLSFTTVYHMPYGQAHSLQQGLLRANAIQRDAAIMVMLADQPFVNESILNSIIEIYRKKEDYKCVGLKHPFISPPIIISPSLFQEIYQLKGDEGARKLIEQHRHESYFLQMNTPNVLVDIDTQEDLNKWIDFLDDY